MKRWATALAACLLLSGTAVAVAPSASAAFPACSGTITMYGDIEQFYVYGKVAVPSAGGSFACIQGKSSSYKAWVKEIQRNLNACNGASLAVDGYYGDATVAAVKAVQAAGEKDGIYGPATFSGMKWRISREIPAPKGGTRVVSDCDKGYLLRMTP